MFSYPFILSCNTIDGFRRLTQGPDAGAYYHELFLKGRPQLCMRMQRQKVKGTGHKLPADAETEPNFYAMVPTSPPSPSRQQEQEEEAQVSVEESPGMQGLRGAANLLQGLSAGLPPAAMLSSLSGGGAGHGTSLSSYSSNAAAIEATIPRHVHYRSSALLSTQDSWASSRANKASNTDAKSGADSSKEGSPSSTTNGRRRDAKKRSNSPKGA